MKVLRNKFLSGRTKLTKLNSREEVIMTNKDGITKTVELFQDDLYLDYKRRTNNNIKMDNKRGVRKSPENIIRKNGKSTNTDGRRKIPW